MKSIEAASLAIALALSLPYPAFALRIQATQQSSGLEELSVALTGLEEEIVVEASGAREVGYDFEEVHLWTRTPGWFRLMELLNPQGYFSFYWLMFYRFAAAGVRMPLVR